MIIDCISDLHGYYPELEGGDLLIVAGDLTASDEPKQYLEFFHWIAIQKYDKKIVIAGNHDNLAQKEGILKIPNGDFEYLNDSGIEIDYYCENLEEEKLWRGKKLKIWGSPWTRSFSRLNPQCMAFTVDKEIDFKDSFGKIPHDTDILITHSPAFGVLDEVDYVCDDKLYVENTGSSYLKGWLDHCGRPKLHVCGHIHEAYGKKEFFNGCISVNASHVNEHYQPVNKPIRIIL